MSAKRSRSHAKKTATGRWPWSCLDCGSTIYHDSLYCRDCDGKIRQPDGSPITLQRPWARFAGWMRGQSYPRFLLSVTLLAVIELILIGFWLSVAGIGLSETSQLVIELLSTIPFR